MRTLITVVQAAALVTMAIALATLPAAAQTTTPTGGGEAKASGSRLRTLDPNAPKPGTWVDDGGDVRVPDLELGTELIELNDRITATGFPPQKEVDRIGFDIGNDMVLGQRNRDSFRRDWKKAETVNDKIGVARDYASTVKSEIRRTGDHGSEWHGKDDLSTSLRRLEWLRDNIGAENLPEESALDDLQPNTFGDAALGIDAHDRARIDAREDHSDAGQRAAENAVRVALADGIRGAQNGARMAMEGTRVAVAMARPRIEAPRLEIRIEHRYR